MHASQMTKIKIAAFYFAATLLPALLAAAPATDYSARAAQCI